MNILVWHFGRKGAGPKYNYEMALALNELTNDDYEIHAAVSNDADNILDYHTAKLKLFSVNTYTGIFSAILSLFKIFYIRKRFIKYVVDNEIDCVYCTMPHIWNFFFSSKLKSIGVRYLLTIHDPASHSGEENKIIDYVSKLDRKNADAIVTLTNYAKDELKHLDKKIFVIPHPAFSFAPAPTINVKELPDEKVKLVFFGRIHHYKGLDILLDAYKKLKSENEKFTLSIYGAGDMAPYMPTLHGLSDVHIENRWILEEEINEIMVSHDICVTPYRDATQSGVIATAMACGVPVIATPVAGLKEQILDGETGLFSDDLTARSLYKVIVRLSNDKLLYENISMNSLKFVKEQMTWEKAAVSSISAIKSLCI